MENVGSVALILKIEPYMSAASDLSAEINGSPDYLGDATTELELYASGGRNPGGNQLEELRFVGLNGRLR